MPCVRIYSSRDVLYLKGQFFKRIANMTHSANVYARIYPSGDVLYSI